MDLRWSIPPSSWNQEMQRLLEGNGSWTQFSLIFHILRMESYSCKMIGTEKQFYKKFAGDSGRTPHTLEALSPPQAGYGCYSYSTSPGSQYSRSFSRSSGSEDECSSVLCDTIERKTLFHLISTLNAAFPDYDFSTAKSDEFTKEPNLQVLDRYLLFIYLIRTFSLLQATWTISWASPPPPSTARSTTSSGWHSMMKSTWWSVTSTHTILIWHQIHLEKMDQFGVSTTSFSTRNLKELSCLHAGLSVHSAKVSMTLV